MKTEIKEGKLRIEAELQPPSQSKTGKSYLVVNTGGFIPVVDEKGKVYKLNLTLITKEK